MSKTKILEPFLGAFNQVKKLDRYDRYVGAFIFGSVVRGDITKDSDIDIKIVVKGKTHETLNHPFLNRIKSDTSFNSLEKIIESTNSEIKKGKRIPMIAESIIVFDKTGELTKLKKIALKTKPKKLKKPELLMTEYFIYNEHMKAKRYINTEPKTALLIMHIGLQFLLELHYQINRRWWISSKRIFKDLDTWDKPLAILVRNFIKTSNANKKFIEWTKIVKYIQTPFGHRNSIKENNCNCKICKKDLEALLSIS